MKVVVDSAPFITLSLIKRSDLLIQLFEEIYTTEGVQREVEIHQKQ